jgi:hypothetical protein
MMGIEDVPVVERGEDTQHVVIYLVVMDVAMATATAGIEYVGQPFFGHQEPVLEPNNNRCYNLPDSAKWVKIPYFTPVFQWLAGGLRGL